MLAATLLASASGSGLTPAPCGDGGPRSGSGLAPAPCGDGGPRSGSGLAPAPCGEGLELASRIF